MSAVNRMLTEARQLLGRVNAHQAKQILEFVKWQQATVTVKLGGGPNTTIESQTTLQATSLAAPTCVKEGFTAETNNLNLTHTPAVGSEASPTLVYEQTNAKATAASCAVAAGT